MKLLPVILSAALLAGTAFAAPVIDTKPVGKIQPPKGPIGKIDTNKIKLALPIISYTFAGATKIGTDDWTAPYKSNPNLTATVSADPKLGGLAGESLKITRVDSYDCPGGSTETPTATNYQKQSTGATVGNTVSASMGFHPDEVPAGKACSGKAVALRSTLTLTALNKNGIKSDQSVILHRKY